MSVVTFSSFDLFTVIGTAISLIVIFITIFIHLDNKMDKLKDNLKENQIALGKLESKIENLEPVVTFIKDVGKKTALETFENMKGVKK